MLLLCLVYQSAKKILPISIIHYLAQDSKSRSRSRTKTAISAWLNVVPNARGRLIHYMAPLTPGRCDQQKNRLIQQDSFLERSLTPGAPMNLMSLVGTWGKTKSFRHRNRRPRQTRNHTTAHARASFVQPLFFRQGEWVEESSYATFT
jgi:hypothetical protein